MAKVRIGFSTQFELENELVGIGTDNPTNTLQALGNIRSSDAKAIGVSTFTTYQGFTDTKLSLEGSAGAKQGTTSGEIVIEGEVTVSTGTTFTSGPENLTVTDSFTLPGISEDKPSVGTTRFNENILSLEFYTGSEWKAVNSYVDMGNRGRAIFGGGYSVSGTNNGNMESVSMMSLGNSVSFGDMVLTAKYSQSGCSDGKRGLWQGGQSVSDIEYITIASEGDSIDFGNLTGANGNHCGSLSSSTRGIRGGGYSGAGLNVMDFVEIQTLGDSLDFGDLLEINYGICGFSSPTRGIFAGGRGADAPLGQTTNNQITIASKGDSIDFGSMSARHAYTAGFSNSVRGFIIGGSSPRTDTIQYVTIATGGNAQDFGNLSVAKEGICSGNAANHVRGFSAGGAISPAGTKKIEYITIATKGNSQDFGDMSDQRGYGCALSDSHGGLGGY